MTEQYPTGRPMTALERFIGGRPMGVVIRLAIVSLIVGFVMVTFGLDAQAILEGAMTLVRNALRDGLGVFGDLGRYILTGAALVVPLWLVLRLLRGRP
ncbi:DUF6460 domain-containing protein [Devosia sp.]|uniref:DUF6460 domain-containing protein n=1 Tax=Devosia sp. TaxID=1871048 RepID=UPI002AFE3786|nr:DUF6460 domain-containing protein [Devosia sp.]